MSKWLATLIKEWRILARDRTGLLMLFVMPAVLVVAMTLVQDNVLRRSGGLQVAGVVVDMDGGEVGERLTEALESSEIVSFTSRVDDRIPEPDEAAAWIEEGRFQFLAVIPKGATGAVKERVSGRIDRLMAGQDAEETAGLDSTEVALRFDPTLGHVYRTAVEGAVARAVATVQTAITLQYLGDALDRNLRQRIDAATGGYGPPTEERLVPSLENDALFAPVVDVVANGAGKEGAERLPTAVQQNVPAWALFGMFFIVVPLSGALIRERREGIWARLMVMPVSKTILILGKLSAYVGVCLVQFVCIVLVGKWLLPLLGTDTFMLGSHKGAIVLVAVCSALAANGFGLMLGVLARTNEQASILGPLYVVIAAALGGIMVPIFAMPKIMQTISRGSPLGWAHEAFMDLLVRDGGVWEIWGHLSLLLLFFLLTLAVSIVALQRIHK
jgi:ABC-2 type transport system permease protein